MSSPLDLCILLLLLCSMSSMVDSTPSVYSCPIAGGGGMGLGLGGLGGLGGGMMPGYGAGVIGEVCGWGSFLHYWTCCDNSPFRCCFQFETWAIVFFSVTLVILVGLCLFAAGRFVSQQQD